MSAPRHRIRRQVLEIVLRRQDDAWRLQSELADIQRRSLEAIIDRCCTEVGGSDRIHRITSLEVDLGTVDAAHLERDLVEKLGPKLLQALAARIREEDEVAALLGDAPETGSQLELLMYFARTGRLPWWADASRPRLVDETVGHLLKRAARPLLVLVRALSRERAELRRIVLPCGEERLFSLFDLLAASSPGLPARRGELEVLLRACPAGAGATPARFRSAVWQAVLRAASIEGSGGDGPVVFWRAVLGHVALELGSSHRALVMALRDAREAQKAPSTEGAARFDEVVLPSLVRELRGESGARDAGLSSLPRDEREEVLAILERLQASGIAPRSLFVELRANESRLSASRRAELLETLRALSRLVSQRGPNALETARAIVALLRRIVAEKWFSSRQLERVREELEPTEATSLPAEIVEEARALLNDAIFGIRERSVAEPDSDSNSDAPPECSSAAEIAAILERLQKSALAPRSLFVELRANESRLSASRRAELLETLRALSSLVSQRGPNALETARAIVALLRRIVAEKWFSVRQLERVREELEPTEATSLPAEIVEEARALLNHAIFGIRERSVAEPDSDSNSDAPPEGSSAAELAAILERLQKSALAPRSLFVELRANESSLPASRRVEMLETLRRLDRLVSQRGPNVRETEDALDSEARALLNGVLDEVREKRADSPPEVTPPEGSSAAELAASLDRLQKSALAPRSLFEELRANENHWPASRLVEVLEALRELERSASHHGPNAQESARLIFELLRRVVLDQWLPARPIERILRELETLEQTAPSSLPAPLLDEARRLLRRSSAKTTPDRPAQAPRIDLRFGESEDVYVDNAGLVILWPFLVHLFERLSLMKDKRFESREALHRAVGLLQYIVTEDPLPPEYQLPLAKALCGMRLDEPFEMGEPVTEVEAEECTNLLTAVIANAPILRDMSIEGFRGSFLIRKGALGTRDGAWLLRVERASYDVVLDRFPWGMSWVKLPWMEAALCVEW